MGITKKQRLLLFTNVLLQHLLFLSCTEASLPEKRAIRKRLQLANPVDVSQESNVPDTNHTEGGNVTSGQEQGFHLPIVTHRLQFPPPDLSRIRPAALRTKDEPEQLRLASVGLSKVDKYLIDTFPGYFHKMPEIKTIDKALTGHRLKRNSDGDLCCRTKLWFGPAPETMTDVNNEGPWVILQGDTVYQAYSRGDCHSITPQPSCPSGGICEQKKRLHTLWIDTGDNSELRYFHINSHCAYEKASPKQTRLGDTGAY